MGQFKIKSTSDGQYMFNLHASNGEIILTSERYQAKSSAQNGVESVRTNAPHDVRYDRRIDTLSRPYFVLKAANGEIIGTSQAYSSASARDKGIESVKASAPLATLVDRTAE